MKNEVYPPHKSSLGNIDANIMALLAYLATTVIGWIPGIRYVAWLAPLVLFFLEKDSRFIKFHSMQAFLLQAVGSIINFILSVIIGGLLSTMLFNYSNVGAVRLGAFGVISIIGLLVSIAITVFAVIAMIGAYQYKETHIPLIGSLAEKFSNRA